MIERCFVMIKPELLKEDKNRGRGALAYLDMLLLYGTNNLGWGINRVELESVPREVIERHYAPHKEKDYYPWIVNQCAEQPQL